MDKSKSNTARLNENTTFGEGMFFNLTHGVVFHLGNNFHMGDFGIVHEFPSGIRLKR
jgi:hypothetical protein